MKPNWAGARSRKKGEGLKELNLNSGESCCAEVGAGERETGIRVGLTRGEKDRYWEKERAKKK